MNAVSDSDVVIDWLQGVPAAISTLAQYETAYVSIVTWMEVLSGARTPAREAAARAALLAMEVVPISGEIAELTVNIRRSRRLKLPDAIILATARHLGCVLLTRNTKDFDPADPAVLVPYTL